MALLDARDARTKTQPKPLKGQGMGILDEEEEHKQSQLLSFRCPPELFERLEAAVQRTGWKRSRLLVRLLGFAVGQLELEMANKRIPKK